MIEIVDYGMGNLRSVEKAFHKIGVEAAICSDPERILHADRVVLPGVGAFGAAIDNLRASGLLDAVRQFIDTGKPFLGICLGLQLLFDESEESFNGLTPGGLGVIPGNVIKFPSEMTGADGLPLKVPQIGWNVLKPCVEDALFAGVPAGSYVYFVHSYYGAPSQREHVLAESEYGVPFCCAVRKGNVRAVQFHPEKSSAVGMTMLRNFSQL
ncbi:MAG: imidazole glycerol phosphate synthase subunit HisH [Armatimonadota bacterium]